MKTFVKVFDYALDPDIDPLVARRQLLSHGLDVKTHAYGLLVNSHPHLHKLVFEVRRTENDMEFRLLFYRLQKKMMQLQKVVSCMKEVDDKVTVWRRHWWYV